MATCSTCEAQIIWAINKKSGRRVPLDAKAEKRYILIEGERHDNVELRNTYVSHFVTCPDAKEHRRKR